MNDMQGVLSPAEQTFSAETLFARDLIAMLDAQRAYIELGPVKDHMREAYIHFDEEVGAWVLGYTPPGQKHIVKEECETLQAALIEYMATQVRL